MIKNTNNWFFKKLGLVYEIQISAMDLNSNTNFCKFQRRLYGEE